MPTDYQVVRADHKKNFNGNNGPMSVYTLTVNDQSGGSETCELVQLEKTPPPQAGQTLEGHIEPNRNPEFPPNFKKAYGGGGGFSGGGDGSKGGGTFKPRDPSEIAGARHAHNLLVAAHSFPPMLNDRSTKEIQERLDDLEAFACVLDEKTAAISDAAKAETKPSPTKDDSLPF